MTPSGWSVSAGAVNGSEAVGVWCSLILARSRSGAGVTASGWSVIGKTQRKKYIHYIAKNGGIFGRMVCGLAVVYLAGLGGLVGSAMPF